MLQKVMFLLLTVVEFISWMSIFKYFCSEVWKYKFEVVCWGGGWDRMVIAIGRLQV